MTGSSRPRLRSEISRGHSYDDLNEGTSARTRPLSYDEIMRRRKSKKEIDVFREEAPATEHAGNKESDASATALKSKDHAREDGSRNMDKKSFRLEDTSNKSRNKESHDSQSKHKYEKGVTNGMEVVKPYRREHVSGKLDEDNQNMDSRSKHKHDEDAKNGPEVSKSDRGGHVTGRIDEVNRDMRPISKDKHENSLRNRAQLLKGDRRANVRHQMDDENRDVDSISKYEHRKYVKNYTQVSKITVDRGFRSGKIIEESHDMDSRSRHDHRNYVKNDAQISKTDVQGYRGGRIDEERHDMDPRSRRDHRNNVKNDAQISKTDGRGYRSGRIDEESHDMDSRSRHDHRNYVKNDVQMPKPDGRGYQSERIVQGHDMDSRSKHDRKHYVRDETQVSKTDGRGYQSGRAVEESHGLNAGYKDKHDKTVKNSTSSLKADRRENVRDKTDWESRDVDSRSKHKHERDRSNNTEDLKNSRQVHGRSKQGEMLRDTAKYDDNDRHPGDSVAQNRYLEKSRGASENEKKRKDRSVDDEKYRPRDSVKKHDSGHRLGSDISGKEKMESSHLRRDESRSKRRRSRSQEPSKSKDRRPRSASPKAHKVASSREHDHGHLSSHTQKEISKPNDDVDRSNTERSRPNYDDRSNTENNGTIGHHRQHSGFSSGLGGYSPRKRKTDAAIKTPSPIHSPERRSAGWDPPQPMSQIMPSNKIDLAIGSSVASSIPLSTTFFHGLSTFKDASVDSVQLTQATRPMRRLYIDNIPASASEKEIMESFNTYLLYSGSNHIRGTRPCINCMIHKEKGQALLEFLTPEDASAALSFDGRSLYGSMLKIRRPKDYVEITSGSVERSKAGAGTNNAISDVAVSDVVKDVVISDIVKDSPHKIFVGGIAEGLSSEMIMEIFSVFGQLKAFRFNHKNLNEPCVFVEYADQSITSKACAALNGMKLGGKILTVALAISDTSQELDYFQENHENEPFYGIPEHVKPLLEKPTLVLKLSNVVDQKSINSIPESDLEEILEDVRLECSRFGSVVSINAATTSNIHTTDSKSEVVNEKLPFLAHEGEAHDHHLNMDLMQVAMENDRSKGNNGKLLTDVEPSDVSKSVEGDKHDLATPAMEVEASTTSTLDTKEADMAANGTPIENTEILNDLDANHEKPVEGNVRLSITDPNDDLDNVKLVDSETSHTDDVEQLDKSTGKQQVAVSVSNDSPSRNQGTEISDVRNIFEVGCILVEFKRTEASCMAAHCLHGRLFDDRIVTVEYVPLEAYQAQFPKGIS